MAGAPGLAYGAAGTANERGRLTSEVVELGVLDSGDKCLPLGPREPEKSLIWVLAVAYSVQAPPLCSAAAIARPPSIVSRLDGCSADGHVDSLAITT
jgi:hypothetical protein